MRRTFMIPILAAALVIPGCGGDDDNGPTTPPTTFPTTSPTSPPETEAADLAVTFVRVYPGAPSLGQPFEVRAQVGNLGDETSGKYDIAGTVRNISTGAVYPVGAKTMEPMLPGEDYTVLQTDVNVADAGSYQFWLEISPFADDADASNDSAGWAFTVNE